MINSLVFMAARGEPASRPFAESLMARIEAFHRAHDFIEARNRQDDGHGLVALLDRLLTPYREQATDRITVHGDDLEIGHGAATALALIFHELATNAVKYGALSMEAGGVSTSRCSMRATSIASVGGSAEARPSVTPPERRGFGSSLVDRAVRLQLGATIFHDWNPEGLTLTFDAKVQRLLA